QAEDEPDEHWLVYTEVLSELDRSLIDPLGDAWRGVEQVKVSVAVPLGPDGRPTRRCDEPLHVYFPTEERTRLPTVLQGTFALDLDRHPRLVLPAVESDRPSRALLLQLGAPDMTVDEALSLLAEPNPSEEAAFYELLVGWAEQDGRRFPARLAGVRCVRTHGG